MNILLLVAFRNIDVKFEQVCLNGALRTFDEKWLVCSYRFVSFISLRGSILLTYFVIRINFRVVIVESIEIL